MAEICSYLELRFYDFDGTRWNTVLPEARGISCTEELQGDGSGYFRAPLLATALQANRDLLEGPGFVRYAMVLQPGAEPVEVAAAELVPTSGSLVGEPGERELTSTAPGLRHLLEAAIVHGEGGAWDKTSEDARLFGWMSKRNGYWYDASDWSTPLSHGFRKLLSNGQGGQKITADLTPAVNDVYLFRSELTITSSTAVKIYWQADDEATLYVDGEVADTCTQANTTQSVLLGWTGGRTHTISAEVLNTLGSEAGLVLMVVNQTTGRVIRRTGDASWTTHKVVGGVKPGWTVGAILRTLHAEANQTTQDVYALEHIIPDFDGVLDSNGDPWPEIDVQGFQVGVDTLGDVLRQLEELGCDSRILPDGTWQAFVSQGEDQSATCWFQEGLNLLDLDYNGTPPTGTKAMVRTPGGWLTRTSTAGVAAYGKRYVAVTSSAAVTTAQGALLADRLLEETAFPRYTYTAVIRAVNGCVPWFDFGVGDLVTCPDRAGDMTAMRVLSITASTPDDAPGPVSFTVELALP